jgi:hypothetical protein
MGIEDELRTNPPPKPWAVVSDGNVVAVGDTHDEAYVHTRGLKYWAIWDCTDPQRPRFAGAKG